MSDKTQNFMILLSVQLPHHFQSTNIVHTSLEVLDLDSVKQTCASRASTNAKSRATILIICLCISLFIEET